MEESSSEDEESSDGDVNGHDAMNSQSSNLPQSQPMVKITYGQQRTFMEEEDDMLETLMDDADETPKALGSHHAVDLGPDVGRGRGRIRPAEEHSRPPRGWV